MNSEITVVLVRSRNCFHCQNFEPIYDYSKKNYKKNNFLKKYNIKFEDFDMVDENIRNTFVISHNKIKDKIQWYPTVFINIRNSDQKNNNEYYTIEHTIINQKINDNEQNNEASKRFLENIENCLKTIESENKILFIQNGGSLKINDYKSKYLKYKLKYLKLKEK